MLPVFKERPAKLVIAVWLVRQLFYSRLELGNTFFDASHASVANSYIVKSLVLSVDDLAHFLGPVKVLDCVLVTPDFHLHLGTTQPVLVCFFPKGDCLVKFLQCFFVLTASRVTATDL